MTQNMSLPECWPTSKSARQIDRLDTDKLAALQVEIDAPAAADIDTDLAEEVGRFNEKVRKTNETKRKDR